MIKLRTFDPSRDKTRSLYIHVPFCRHRCGYCNFSLVAGRDELIDQFLTALETEIGWLSHAPAISTVFLGGGTPSHLSPVQIQRLFQILQSHFRFSATAEITIECNPNDLNEEKSEVLASCGVNRISFGVQSFRDEKLKILERDHTTAEIFGAIDLARKFTSNVAFDLIFAAPNETHEHWMQDLNTAISLSPQHLSTYELTIEKGTSFWNRNYHGRLTVPDENARADMFQATITAAVSQGFEHYEISSFGKPGFRCQHNLSYWNGDDYLAFGPGAARFIDGVREVNHRSTTTYLKRIESNQSPVADRESMSPQDIAIDRIVFGLRQIDGFSLSEFTTATGINAIEVMAGSADLLIEKSLLQIDGDVCKLTQSGVLVYDAIAAKIVATADAGY